MKEMAIFAGGCFWGVQYYFDQVPGVLETEVGYIGGNVDNPSYEQVSYEDTGHAEATKITFDPKKVSYETLLKQFFRMHDPTQMNRQGPDVGDQYRSAVFYLNDKQKTAAEQMIKLLNKSSNYSKPIVTQLEPAFAEASAGRKAGKFWPAEDYHQKYTQKTGLGMCHVDYAPIK